MWACCLMPNHVHLILVPHDRDGLRAAIAEAHRRYTHMINARMGWTGYLWQGPFASLAMVERAGSLATRRRRSGERKAAAEADRRLALVPGRDAERKRA